LIKRVWIDAWQIQSSGDPFDVGSEVAWALSPSFDADYLGAVLGKVEALRVTDAWEPEGELPDDVPATAGTVRAISAVYCRFAPLPGGHPKTNYPVTGSTSIEPRISVDGWEHEDEGDDLQFIAYVVDLDVP